jgi:hypothetical protein
VTEITTKAFLGIELAVGCFDDGRARVRDIELGRFLGYSRPRKIRELIEKEIAAGNLSDSDVRPVAGQTTPLGGRPGTEYLLTEEGALFVASRSETKAGAQVLRGLIAAYEAARHDSARVTKILELCFQNEPRQVKPMFSRLIAGIIRMRGEQDGPANPAWARGLAQMIYRWAFGDDLNEDGEPAEQRLRRSLNPDPSSSRVDYSWLTDDGLRQVERVIQCGEDYADTAQDWAEWRDKMRHRWEGRPLQLMFLGSPRRLGAAE